MTVIKERKVQPAMYTSVSTAQTLQIMSSQQCLDFQIQNNKISKHWESDVLFTVLK